MSTRMGHFEDKMTDVLRGVQMLRDKQELREAQKELVWAQLKKDEEDAAAREADEAAAAVQEAEEAEAAAKEMAEVEAAVAGKADAEAKAAAAAAAAATQAMSLPPAAMVAPQIVPTGAGGLTPPAVAPCVLAAAAPLLAATSPGPAAPLLGQPGQFAPLRHAAPAGPAPPALQPGYGSPYDPQQLSAVQQPTTPGVYGGALPQQGGLPGMNPLPAPVLPPPQPQPPPPPQYAPIYHGGLPPAAAAPPPAPPPQLSSSRMPVDKVVDDVAAMGFSREHVRGWVNRLTTEGHQIDLNVVLDKLMNGA